MIKSHGEIMIKPIKVNLPYPSVDQITPNLNVAKVIAKAYSGGHSELNATLQYIYHFFNFQVYDKEIANTLMGIAITEMEHLEILGKTLIQLGVNPIFYDYSHHGEFYSTKNLSYSQSPEKMLLDDLSGEMLAIQDYKQMANTICDDKVKAILCRIVLDEELHVAVLKDALNNYLSPPTCF